MAVAAGLGVSIVPAAQAQSAPPAPGVVVYRAPTDAPVIDTFRPPAHIGGRGNRGLEYATRPGSAIRAAAPGRVTFAGRVGAGLHVTVSHPDGVRTSYSFLRSVAVGASQRVTSGQLLGTAGASFHFGARIGEAYVDPAVLLGSTRSARLVPVSRFGAVPGPGRSAGLQLGGRFGREWSAAAGR